jgi:Tfp pilus assembly protein PilO
MTLTNKILLAVAATAAALCAFYFLALAPKRDQVAKLDADIAAKRGELAQARGMLATYEAARESYKANYTLLARLGKAVPPDDDVRSMMVQLQSTANTIGVDFEKIELGTSLAGATSATTPAAGSGSTGGANGSTGNATSATGELATAPGTVPFAGGVLLAMPFNFTFDGGYLDLSTFFVKLERYVTLRNNRIDVTGRLLRLESVSITPAATGFPEMQAQVGAATYIVPPVEGVAGAPAQAAGTNPSTTPSSTGTTPSNTTATVGATE